MKKKYEKPLAEVVRFDTDEDLLVDGNEEGSGTLGGGDKIPGWE